MERKCEDNHQNIRYDTVAVYPNLFLSFVMLRYLLETGEKKAEESNPTKEDELDENSNNNVSASKMQVKDVEDLAEVSEPLKDEEVPAAGVEEVGDRHLSPTWRSSD